MRRWRSAYSVLASFGLLVACGGARQVAPPAQAATVVATPATDADEPELSPVEAPADLVMVARWQAPAATVDTVIQWAGMPLPWRSLLDRSVPDAARGKWQEVLALEKPVDVVLTLGADVPGQPPNPNLAFAVGIQSIDGALDLAEAMGETVESLGGGCYAVLDGHDLSCVVGPSLGASPARLVCSDEQHSAAALLPYLTRGLPTESLSEADIHVRVNVEPLRRAFGPSLRQAATVGLPVLLNKIAFDDPALDRAIADVVHGTANELLTLVDDANRITLDVDLDETVKVARTKVALQFGSTKSWVAQSVLDVERRRVAAPAEFWALPRDVGGASFSAPPNPQRLAGIKEHVARVADAFAAKASLPDRVRRDIAYVVEHTANSPTPIVTARGGVPPLPKSASLRGLRGMMAQLPQQFGWIAYRYLGADPDEQKKYFDTLVRAYNDPATQRALKGLLSDGDKLPRLRARPVYGHGLPGGTQQYEFALGGLLDGFPDYTLVVVVMPQGDDVWVGYSFDEKRLHEMLARVRQPSQTLQGRPGLESLRGRSYSVAGFTTLRTLVEPAMTRWLRMDQPQIDRAFNIMTHHGETPMVTTVAASTSGGTRLELTWDLPQEVLQDVAAMAPIVVTNAFEQSF